MLSIIFKICPQIYGLWSNEQRNQPLVTSELVKFEFFFVEVKEFKKNHHPFQRNMWNIQQINKEFMKCHRLDLGNLGSWLIMHPIPPSTHCYDWLWLITDSSEWKTGDLLLVIYSSLLLPSFTSCSILTLSIPFMANVIPSLSFELPNTFVAAETVSLLK